MDNEELKDKDYSTENSDHITFSIQASSNEENYMFILNNLISINKTLSHLLWTETAVTILLTILIIYTIGHN